MNTFRAFFTVHLFLILNARSNETFKEKRKLLTKRAWSVTLYSRLNTRPTPLARYQQAIIFSHYTHRRGKNIYDVWRRIRRTLDDVFHYHSWWIRPFWIDSGFSVGLVYNHYDTSWVLARLMCDDKNDPGFNIVRRCSKSNYRPLSKSGVVAVVVMVCAGKAFFFWLIIGFLHAVIFEGFFCRSWWIRFWPFTVLEKLAPPLLALCLAPTAWHVTLWNKCCVGK